MHTNGFETTNIDNILSYFDEKSHTMSEYIKDHFDSEFLLIYKYITHSDLANRGKRNGNKENISKNYLYYLSDEDMVDLEISQEKKFESAKQSNIGILSNFYKGLGIEQLQRRKGAQKTQHHHIVINDYADVYLVNENMKYFKSEYTKKILDIFGKRPSWYDEDIDVKLLEDSDFTPIQLSHAIHGVGTAQDKEFSKLRLNIFKNDMIIFLIESRPDFKKNLFILLDKNPIFYTLLGESNSAWQKYMEKQQKMLEYKLKDNKSSRDLIEEKDRKEQSKWRNLLASEMMNYSTVEGEVFCPFTYITCDYNTAGTLFRASHIKAFSECESQVEAYDINNGLLLSANADALFDKHLISVDENKNLLYSFTIKNDFKLLSNLLLDHQIFKKILNEDRMKYMAIHRNEFYKQEELRKQNL